MFIWERGVAVKCMYGGGFFGDASGGAVRWLGVGIVKCQGELSEVGGYTEVLEGKGCYGDVMGSTVVV